jgi:hypothetical protein
MRAMVVVYLWFICKYDGKEKGENYWERLCRKIQIYLIAENKARICLNGLIRPYL